MTPHQDSGKGSLLLDRTFPGVGRVKRASGLPNTLEGRKRFKRLNRMLSDLYEAGLHEYLTQLRKREIHPLQLWSAYQAHKLERLPTADLLKPLAQAMGRWADTSPTGAHNRASRHDAVRILTALSGGATVGDLPDLLQKYQAKAQDTPSMYNHVKTHAQKFLGQLLGKTHPLYADVLRLEPLKVTVKRKRGLTLLETRAVWAFLPEPMRLAFRALCLTGMRPAEYLGGDWQVLQDRIEVYGTKTKGAAREVPLVEPITLIRVTLPSLRYHLNKWPDAKLEPYTARRTYAHFMEEAGIPRARRKMYLGHSGVDRTDLYERPSFTAYLKEDGAKLRAYLGVEGLVLVKVSK